MEEGGRKKKKNTKKTGRLQLSSPNMHSPTPPTTQATNGRIQGVLREKRAKGQIQEEKAPHNIGLLKGLYCLPATTSVPSTCWALQDSPTNPEDLGNVATVQLSLPRGSRYSLGRQCSRGPQSEGKRAEQHPLWRRTGERTLLDAHRGGMS